jgi:hypothetical protein
VPGVVVIVGGEVLALFAVEVAPRLAEPRDDETRLEPAIRPRPLGDTFDLLSREEESTGSSDS